MMPVVLSSIDDKTLTVDVLTDNEIEATFIEENSNIGIKLSASAANITVESLQDEHLVTMQDQFMRVLDTGFLRFQGEDYVIPNELIPQALQAKSQENLPFFIEQLRMSPSMQSSESAIESAMHQLAVKPEAQLFIEASEALGNQNITGVTHPKVLPLLVFATRLQYVINHNETEQADINAPVNIDGSRHPRSQYCSLEDDPNNNNCFGMCGLRCSCIWWMCGDCCYHLGCAEHDACCRESFWSCACLNVFAIRCDGYSPNC